MLEINDLTIQYGAQPPTVEHFDLSMKQGEIISVVGESGVLQPATSGFMARACWLSRRRSGAS